MTNQSDSGIPLPNQSQKLPLQCFNAKCLPYSILKAAEWININCKFKQATNKLCINITNDKGTQQSRFK